MTKKEKNLAQIYNIMLYQKFTNLIQSRFVWSGLEFNNKGLTSRYIEKVLTEYGKGALFLCENHNALIFGKSQNGGTLGVYDVYTQQNITLGNGELYVKNSDEIAICRNNSLEMIDTPMIIDYVNKIYFVDKVIKMNLAHQLTPYIFSCNEETYTTFKNFMKNLFNESSEQGIFLDESINHDSIKPLGLNAEYLIEKLTTYRDYLTAELLQMYGIPVNPNKSERLLKSEMLTNNIKSNCFIWDNLNSRLQFCEDVKKMFDIDLKVELNPRIDEVFNISDFFDFEKGEEENVI